MDKYIYKEHTADLAFEAYGTTLSELFENAALAFSNATIEDLDKVEPIEIEHIQLSSDSKEQLLIDFLEELVFIKDTKHLVFSEVKVHIHNPNGHPLLEADCKGEQIDLNKHTIGNDVKAITYHDFKLAKEGELWTCYVLFDI